MDLQSLSTEQLVALQHRLRGRYEEFKARGINLNMARGKPGEDQLTLAQELLGLPGVDDATSESGDDVRNYFGEAQGLRETRRIFAGLMGAPIEQIVLGDNSSLALMHDVMAYAMLFGLPSSQRPWSKEDAVTFLCPAPGYDRHFGLCEGFGIKMIPIPMTGAGPDMDMVERLAGNDPTVRGIWCVPRFSNPTGDVYSEETVKRLAGMQTAAPDFTLFWDNAYGVHTLTETPPELANIVAATAEAGNPDRVFVFGSTSKITLAGAGIAMVATSPTNVTWLLKHMGRRSIGPDKINQLRHARFLKDEAGLKAHMAKHRAILAPKFARVHEMFAELLSGTGAATWTKPEGGYFISLDVMEGCAKRVVALAKEAGITVVPAGQTFPYSQDPRDTNIRIAPSYPSETEVEQAAEGIAICSLLAASEKILATRS
ncbi:MAG: aminotransferase class I/II-fold pyridoxal phosphate-dependent enzyme [Chloroflexi bacterium]|nr:aminotransferase class I/II-fold pyridoxal phosphate-dependent enzyme [Chloroflexota bacterium]